MADGHRPSVIWPLILIKAGPSGRITNVLRAPDLRCEQIFEQFIPDAKQLKHLTHLVV